MDSVTSTDRILAFLDSIGIPYRATQVAEGTFLPGITIEAGGVDFDPDQLNYPGDILHEAGHIALTPATERSALCQVVLDAQSPGESVEVGVLLWTYLAAKEIGLPLEVVFHAGGYKDGSGWLIEQFESGNLIGLPLLNWMGVTEATPSGVSVVSWLRP